ncbi:MAG: ABC transporter permease [Acidobacteria bacterium]|nr:ABC transporter permease [Acidobacteriota bacterium]
MAIPIAYNIRNLVVRRTTTIMTALGIALTVAVLAAALAVGAGLAKAFRATGHPNHLLLLRKGSTSELISSVPIPVFKERIKLRNGVAKSAKGEPMASPETILVVSLPSVEAPEGMNLTLRALGQVGLEMREDCRIIDGRWFQPGRREIVVGSAVAKRYPDAQIGKKITFGRGQWDVVGVFDSEQMARNSEIWGDFDQISGDFNRLETASSVLVRADDEVALEALKNELNTDVQLQVEIMTEKAYYAAQTDSADPLKFLGIFVAVIMAIGSCFAAMNTMYAAVARRSKEIGTLRILGFSKGSILLSFFVESILIAALGGLLGLLLVLPLNGVTTGVGSNLTFAEIGFELKITPPIAAAGMAFALFMGALGGLLPAGSAARKEILTALRDV